MDTKEKIKVSVIVPIYNVEKYLARCLDSIIAQTLKDIEIICVNDGSTDKSLAILKEYAKKDNRITIICQENKGLSGARNTGMAVATGKYLGFVDSDDWVNAEFYERLYNAAEKHEADIACAGVERNYKSGRKRIKLFFVNEQVAHSAKEKYDLTKMPGKCYAWNKIYKRDIIQSRCLKFKEGAYFEDLGFVMHALYYSRNLVTVPGAKYHYWVNTESITRQPTDKKQLDALAARADFIEFSRKHNITCDEKYYVKSKTVYKFLGIPLMKVYEWETIKKYYLFSLFPIFEKRISL
ncbi:MAG: glycosyltransferase [Alphaproteobacteria bacterium]|nr:glycosyltransferase [Alphaproteobacteria bacterium]